MLRMRARVALVALAVLAAPVSGVQREPWDTVTTAQLRDWRGAISTVLAPMPCGPRPGRADNVLFTAQIDSTCWDAAARRLAFQTYRAHGYTHWIMGPMVQQGYHGQYPDSDWRTNPDVFFDRVEEVWRAGFIPGVFTVPDTGLCADGRRVDVACLEREFGAIYRSPRAQALLRVVASQWEPADWHPRQWGEVARWLADVFPDAVRVIHLPSNLAAPCHSHDLPRYGLESAAQCWVLARMDLWHQVFLQESWTFMNAPGYVETVRTPEEQFVHDLREAVRRLRDGQAGWPVTSAWGPGTPLDIIAFEYASYAVTPRPQLAGKARAWGALALTVDGIRGFGDGGPPTPRIMRE